MNVQVKYRLSRFWANVDDGAVPLLDVPLACNLSGGQMTTSNHFRIFGLRLFQSGKMFLRDHQHVRGRFGINVFKGKHVRVLINLVGWNLAAQDAAEEAGGSRVGHGMGNLVVGRWSLVVGRWPKRQFIFQHVQQRSKGFGERPTTIDQRRFY
jgi:hypothetical protein